MPGQKLSKNFSLSEFTRSQTAARLGIDNTPSVAEKENIQKLTDNVLQPLRNALGAVFISSGYRCKRLNEAVGGVDRIDPNTGERIVSQHVKGQAADIVVSGHSVEEVFNWIADNLEYDQLIYEFGSWIHVSYNDGHNRMQKLAAYKDGNSTHYKEIERA